MYKKIFFWKADDSYKNSSKKYEWKIMKFLSVGMEKLM